MPHRARFMEQIAAPESRPGQMMEALDRLADQVVGAKLCTLLRIDMATGAARRIHSTEPDLFPISGSRSLDPSEWSDLVLGRQQIFVANSYEDMAKALPDAELIRSVGCESCITIPIVVQGRLLGTLNCLHEAGHYTPDRVAAAESLKLPAAIALMASLGLDGIATGRDQKKAPGGPPPDAGCC